MNERIVVHPPKKDAKSKFYVTVSYYVDGVRRQKRKSGFIKSADAKKAGEAIRKRLEEEMPVIKATGSHRMTLREFSVEYIGIRTDWAHNTLKIRRDALRHCDFIDKPLIEITKMDLAKNIKRLENKYAYNTVAATLSGLKVFLNAAVEYNHLVTAPTYKLKKPEKHNEVENVMSVESATKLIEKIKDKEVHLVCLIGMTTGARISESVDMNVNDIDFKKGTWNIQHQYKYVKGQGYKHDQPLKTENSYREVPLPPKTIDAINSFPFRTIDGYIFGKAPSCLGRKANRHIEKLADDFSFHGFRHTYITNLIRSKQFDLQSIAKLAGDTIETIIETYSHYLNEMQEENIEKIKTLFG